MSPTAVPHPPVLLLAAPPVGAAAWDQVIARLAHHGIEATAIDLFDAQHAEVIRAEGSLGLVDALAKQSAGTCVVAHGLAVPLALHLARRTAVARLVLSNGPIHRLDPTAAAFCRLAQLPGPVGRLWSRPALLRPFLASSVALRRLVVNPYVMDRDMVVRVSESWTLDRTRRQALVRWLRDLPGLVASAPPPPDGTTLIWGDEDLLYPAHVADHATGMGASIRHLRVPGGQHLHPIERPWELADAVAQLPQGTP